MKDPLSSSNPSDLVERYLRGDLDEASEAAFEERLLTSRELQDALENEMELDQRLGSALQWLDESDRLPMERTDVKAATETAPAEVLPLQPRTRQTPAATARRWQPLAWAASLLMALLPALLLFNENSRLEEELSGAQGNTQAGAQVEELLGEVERLRQQVSAATRPQVDLPVLRLEPVRSQSEAASYRLTLTEDSRWVVLVIQPPAPIAESYTLSLNGPENTGDPGQDPAVSNQRFEATPDAYGDLTISLYSAELEAGVYRLEAAPPGGPAFETKVEFRR